MTPPNNPKARVVEIIAQSKIEWENHNAIERTLAQFTADRLDAAGLLVKPWVSLEDGTPKIEGWLPKDGQTVLCFDGDDYFVRTFWEGESFPFTHWQPLPKEPS